MGYASRLEGGIGIVPPLTWGELRELDPKYLRSRGDNSLVIDVVEEAEDDDQGTRITRRGVAIVSGHGEDFVRHGCVLAELDWIVKKTRGRTFTGGLVRWGERRNDVERYRVTDRGVPGNAVAISEKAEVVVRWPDGSEDQAPEF